MVPIWGQIYNTQHTICKYLNQGTLSADRKVTPRIHTSDVQSRLSAAE